MMRKQMITLCFLVCALTISPVFNHAQEQKSLTDDETAASLGEVRSADEVRRAAESKTYNEGLKELQEQSDSQLKKDLEGAKRKITRMKPEWLSDRAMRSIGTALIVCAAALYILRSLQRRKKKRARNEFKNLREEIRKQK